MEVDSSTINHVEGNSEEQSLKHSSSKNPDFRPTASEMTSADYYFDSYAHFGR